MINNILKKIKEDIQKASDGEKIYSDMRLDLYYDNAISESNNKENVITSLIEKNFKNEKNSSKSISKKSIYQRNNWV